MNRRPLVALLAGALAAAACEGEAPLPAPDPTSLRRPPAGESVAIAICTTLLASFWA